MKNLRILISGPKAKYYPAIVDADKAALIPGTESFDPREFFPFGISRHFEDGIGYIHERYIRQELTNEQVGQYLAIIKC